jgi:hypothetical protein
LVPPEELAPMKITTLSAELVFAIVRGQLPLSSLEEAGVSFEIDGVGPGQERWIKPNVKVPFIGRNATFASTVVARRATR